MPSSHRRYAEWTPDRFRRWAGKIGPNTECLIVAVLASRPHPEQGFRTAWVFCAPYRGLDAGRVEAISARAVELGVLNLQGRRRASGPQGRQRRRQEQFCGSAVRPRQSARPRLLPLKRKRLCSPTPRSTN